MSAPVTPKVYRVDPARLASGTWCHTRDRQIGEGDICASYSCDKIGLEGKVRKPFVWQNALWVCTGMRSADASRCAEAYRHGKQNFILVGLCAYFVPKSDSEVPKQADLFVNPGDKMDSGNGQMS